ncbi:MinD/ParA family ATP-binding protein [Rhodococcus sp. Leaf278]|uniref:MinD/ParA family ATP-binding protein n=1 Tax=Rhodococcus sp. Leaf278 TaxID=1736319 RepID=UPI003FA7131A
MPPYGQGGPQGHWGPQGQWGPQNQWSAQPGQWPQPPYPTAPHPPHPPGQVPPSPQQTQQRGAVDPPVLVPQVVAVGQGLPADRAMLQPVSARDLGNSLLVRSANVPPVSGWRRALYVMSGGRIDVGNSAAQQRRLELTAQVDRTLVGCYRVAVLSLKGGVGKTTTTATLGSTFAHIRGDRVIAIDANPDRGTLGQKVPCETTATVRNLLRDIDSVDRYSDVRAYTSQNANRLEVLASDSDPAASEAFSGEDYDRAVAMLEKFYSIVITDCGTGLMHSAMESILEGTDTLVVVSSASVDGARSASATLDWLDAHGYRTLVATSVAVVNGVRPRAGKVDLQRVIEHFEQRCAHVLTIPFDPHLEEGAEIELDRLHGRTRTALLEVAAAVAAGFPDSPTASDPS